MTAVGRRGSLASGRPLVELEDVGSWLSWLSIRSLAFQLGKFHSWNTVSESPYQCKCLLIQPNAESALNEEAGKMLLEAYEDFSTRAKMMTELWAKPKAGDKALLSSDDVMAAQTKRDLQDGAKPVSKKEKKQKKAAKKKASGLGRL